MNGHDILKAIENHSLDNAVAIDDGIEFRDIRSVRVVDGITVIEMEDPTGGADVEPAAPVESAEAKPARRKKR